MAYVKLPFRVDRFKKRTKILIRKSFVHCLTKAWETLKGVPYSVIIYLNE